MKEDKLIFKSDRSFYIKSYQTSISILTICGNKYAEEGDTRMEIVFSGVYYLEIPTGFMTLEIRKATPEETEALRRRRKVAKNQPPENGNVFILTANQETYFIGAWRVDCREVPLNSE